MKIRKIISLIIIITFLTNSLAYSLAYSLGVSPGVYKPLTKRGMDTLARVLWAQKTPPSQIASITDELLKKITNHEFVGTAPELKEVKGVVHSALDEGVKGLSIDGVSANDILKALEEFCLKRSAFKENLGKGSFAVIEKNYKYDKEDGEVAVSRIEGKSIDKCKLVVHTDYKNAVQDILKKDIWFDYEFDDGKTKRVSVAEAVFNRPAKHYLRESEKDYKNRDKTGGHLVSPDQPLVSEQEANNISGRYAFVNDAIYLWFLASYSFKDTTRYNNQLLEQRLRWIYANKEVFDFKNQFPNINDRNLEEVIKFTLFVNYHYFNRKGASGEPVKVSEVVYDSYEETISDEDVLAYMGGIDGENKEIDTVTDIADTSQPIEKDSPQDLAKRIKEAQKVESFSRNEIIMFGVGVITLLSFAIKLTIALIAVYYTNWYALLALFYPAVYYVASLAAYKIEKNKFRANITVQKAQENLNLWMQDEKWREKANSLNLADEKGLMNIIRIVRNQDVELRMFEIIKFNVTQSGAKEIIIRAGYVNDKKFVLKLLKNAFYHYNRPPPEGIKNEIWRQISAINSEYGFPQYISFLTLPFALTKFINTFPSRNLEIKIPALLKLFKIQDKKMFEEPLTELTGFDAIKYIVKRAIKISGILVFWRIIIGATMRLLGAALKCLLSCRSYKGLTTAPKIFFHTINMPQGILCLGAVCLPFIAAYVLHELIIVRRYSLGYKEEKVLFRRNPFLFLNSIKGILSEIKHDGEKNKSVSFEETKRAVAQIIQSSYTIEEIEDKMIYLGVIPARLKTKQGKKTFLTLCSSLWNIVSQDVPLPEALELDNDFNFPRYRFRVDGSTTAFYGFAHGLGRYIFLKNEVANLVKKLDQEGIFFHSEQNMSDTYGYCEKIIRNIIGGQYFIESIAGKMEEKKKIFEKNLKCRLEINRHTIDAAKDEYKIEIIISGENKILTKGLIDLLIEKDKKRCQTQKKGTKITVKDVVAGKGSEIDDFKIIKDDKESFLDVRVLKIMPILENIFQYLMYPLYMAKNPSSGLLDGGIKFYSVLHQRTIDDLKMLYLLNFLGTLPEPLNFTSEKYLNPTKRYDDERVGRSFYMLDYILQKAKLQNRKHSAWIGGIFHQPLMVWLAQHLGIIQRFKEEEGFYSGEETEKKGFIRIFLDIIVSLAWRIIGYEEEERDEGFYLYRETDKEDFLRTIKSVLGKTEKSSDLKKEEVKEKQHSPKINKDSDLKADIATNESGAGETGIIKIISDYILRIARKRGPGAVPLLGEGKQKNIWQTVKAAHQTNIAVLLPMEIDKTLEQDIKKMEKNMATYGKKLKVSFYKKGTLRSRLANCRDMKKIVVTNADTAAYIGKLMQDKDTGETNADMFRDVRLLNMKIPKIKNKKRETVFHSEIIMTAILARLLDQGSAHFDIIRGLLKDLMEDSFVSSKVKIDDFIQELAVKEDNYTDIEKIKQRVYYFLQETPAISLIKRLEQELRAIKEFWSYA
ncbi:MAG: hypothetical protein ABIH09_05740 [Candidatus Omnitrophota bacterium]